MAMTESTGDLEVPMRDDDLVAAHERADQHAVGQAIWLIGRDELRAPAPWLDLLGEFSRKRVERRHDGGARGRRMVEMVMAWARPRVDAEQGMIGS